MILLVLEDELLLCLLEIDNIELFGIGESLLVNIEDWVNVYDENGCYGKWEINMMLQWVGFFWYWLCYIDLINDKEFVFKEVFDYWLLVDFYVGGVEYVVLYFLYVCFWYKVFYDFGLVLIKELFMKLVNQGMILGFNYEKMFKFKGNVVNLDDIVD